MMVWSDFGLRDATTTGARAPDESEAGKPEQGDLGRPECPRSIDSIQEVGPGGNTVGVALVDERQAIRERTGAAVQGGTTLPPT
jgi:hypothetical protein